MAYQKVGFATKPERAKRIYFDEMEDGDILLLKDWKSAKTHMGIAAFQALASHSKNSDSSVTHAGMFNESAQSILEASGAAGLRDMPLARKHSGYKFETYRYRGPNSGGIIKEAHRLAKELVKVKLEHQLAKSEFDAKVYTAKGGDNYDKLGCYVGGGLAPSGFGKNAIADLQAMHDILKKGGTKEFKFYCSNFVVTCYQLAEMNVTKCKAKDVACIPAHPKHVSPKKLQGKVRTFTDNWSCVGTYVTDSKDTQPETRIWSPHSFVDHTTADGSRPQILKNIAIRLENYHGISQDLLDVRSRNLKLIGDDVANAMLSKKVKDVRKKHLMDFLMLVNMEKFELDDALKNK